MTLKTLKHYCISFIIAIASVYLTACSSENEDSAEQGITISGTISDSSSSAMGKLNQQKVSASSLSEYEIYCVTFQDQPYAARSPLGQDGHFSLQMPVDVAFGCFINHIESQVPVATIAISGEGENFGDNASTALRFEGSADFGTLALDLDRAQVLIPRENVENVLPQNPSSGIDLAQVHNQSYTMRCLPTGNQHLDQACDANIASDDGDNDIFFRIMSATRGSEAINGIGVWESEQAFSDCGSIDLMDSTVADLATDESINFTADGVVSGPSFSSGAQCPLRDLSQPVSHENLDLYYAAGELVRDGEGYTLYARDSRMANPGCIIENTTVVHFNGE